MVDRAVASAATLRWATAWGALSIALAVHVADEAMTGFLAVWNPLVVSLRERLPFVPLPTFRFEIWLGGLIAAVVLLLSLWRYVHRGAPWMVPVSYVLTVMMCGNGLLHLAGSVYQGRAMPGLYSSPLLVAAAIFLFTSTRRFRRLRQRAPISR